MAAFGGTLVGPFDQAQRLVVLRPRPFLYTHFLMSEVTLY